MSGPLPSHRSDRGDIPPSYQPECPQVNGPSPILPPPKDCALDYALSHDGRPSLHEGWLDVLIAQAGMQRSSKSRKVAVVQVGTPTPRKSLSLVHTPAERARVHATTGQSPTLGA